MSIGTELDECFSYRRAYRATRPTLLSTVTAGDWISLWTFWDAVSFWVSQQSSQVAGLLTFKSAA